MIRSVSIPHSFGEKLPMLKWTTTKSPVLKLSHPRPERKLVKLSDPFLCLHRGSRPAQPPATSDKNMNHDLLRSVTISGRRLKKQRFILKIGYLYAGTRVASYVLWRVQNP